MRMGCFHLTNQRFDPKYTAPVVCIIFAPTDVLFQVAAALFSGLSTPTDVLKADTVHGGIYTGLDW